MVGIGEFFAAGVESEIQFAQAQTHVGIGDFGLEVQLDAFGGLDLDDQSVGFGTIGFFLAEEQMGWFAELDNDLSGSATHRFAASKIERNASPSPVIDIELQSSERLGLAFFRHPFFVEVVLVLTSDSELGKVATVVRPDGLEDFHFFVSDEFSCVANWGFHGRDHHQLKQVVLEHVSQDP